MKPKVKTTFKRRDKWVVMLKRSLAAREPTHSVRSGSVYADLLSFGTFYSNSLYSSSLLIVFSFVLSLPGFALNTALEKSTPIGQHILLSLGKVTNEEGAKVDTGYCSAQIVKFQTPTFCGKTKIIYSLVSAAHCNHIKGDIGEPDELEFYKNINAEKACVRRVSQQQQIKSPQVNEAEISMPVRSSKAPYEFKTRNFEAVFKLAFARSAFKAPSIPHRDPQKKSKGLNPSGENKDQPKTSKTSPALTDAELFVEDVVPNRAGFKSTLAPIPADRADINICSDLTSAIIPQELAAQAGVSVFEVADRLPQQGDPVTVMGYQFGCNPVKLECHYVGASKLTDGREMESIQPTIRCPDGSKSYVGVSGGAILNQQGELIGTVSKQSNGKYDGDLTSPSGATDGSEAARNESVNRETEKLPYFAFAPVTKRMVNCEGALVAPKEIEFDGFVQMGKVMPGRKIANYDAGCYVEDTYRDQHRIPSGAGEVPVPPAAGDIGRGSSDRPPGNR